MMQEEVIQRLVEWAEKESQKAQELDAFRNSRVHLFEVINKKDYPLNKKQLEHFKQVWESYGVKFQNDDGTYKSAYEVLSEMSLVFKNLKGDKQ